MVDARSIIDILIKGASQQTAPYRERGNAPRGGGGGGLGSGGIGDIMGEIFGKLGKGGGFSMPGAGRSGGGGGGMGDLGRFAREALGGGQPDSGGHSSDQRPAAPDYERREYTEESEYQPQQRTDDGRDVTDIGGGLEDIVNRYERKSGSGQSSGQGSIFDMLGKNKMAAGAIIAGLGGLLLGTKTGRSLTGSAVKVGGLALIGGLAYKAYKNYQNGAAVTKGQSVDDLAAPAPDDSGFEETAQSNDHATIYLRAMIAAAAADGEIDREEREAIIGNLQEAGLDKSAARFIQQEFANPATVGDLVDAATSQEMATQIYTAARIAIEPDTSDERYFLEQLADNLGLDPQLVAHVDAAASDMKA